MTDGDGPARNFRSAYYEKLGFCGNEEKNILDLLIASNPNREKCVEAWKILLGVDCGRKNPFDEFENVRQIRAEHFQSLKHHLKVLLRHNIVIRDRLKNCSTPEPLENQKTQEEQTNLDITLMYLLEAGQLEWSDLETQLNSEYCRKLSAMASFFVNVSEDLQDAFFLFRNFTRKLERDLSKDQ